MLAVKIINSICLNIFVFSYVFQDLLQMNHGVVWATVTSLALTALGFGVKKSREILIRQGGPIFTIVQSVVVILLLFLRFYMVRESFW